MEDIKIYATTESENNLSKFFSGEVFIIYEPYRKTFHINIKNDDLKNPFYYEFPYEKSITKERRIIELKSMMDKYIKQMEIEQQLLKKGVLKFEKFN